MSRQDRVERTLETEQDTDALGRCIAASLRPGDTLLLSGGLGAGKTHLARAIIARRLAEDGVAEDIPSPTYTLVQTYETSAGPIWHADLYRLGAPDEVIELGLDEAFGRDIVLVEWPERLGDFAPSDALRITLSPWQGGRRLAATGPAETLRRLFGRCDA